MKKYLAALPLAALAAATACSETSPTEQLRQPPVEKPAFDDISNNLDASIDAVAEAMPLTLGGANGTTQLYVTPRNGDGKNGCNLTGGTTLVVSVSSSNTSVATVSPSSVTFTSCGNTPTLTITPVGQGSASISVSQVSNNTGGTFVLGFATFTVNVAPPPNTAPSLNITGVTGGASYEIGSVPVAMCQVTDTEDGNSSFPATLSAISGPLAAYGLGEQTANCSYTDGGGLTASSSVTYGIVDTAAPMITFQGRTPAANTNGWHNSEVVVLWTCTDSGAGVVEELISQTVSTDGTDQSVTGTCIDHAGNTASDTQTGINIDRTAPVIELESRTPANSFGWNNSDVTVAWTCSDSGSGVVSGSETQSVILTTEGEAQSASATCSDLAGNTASDTQTGINIDKTNPTIGAASRSPLPNSMGWNNSNVTVSWPCSDNEGGSGVVTESASTIVSADGDNQSAMGTCTDRAGNTASDTQNGINIDKTAPSIAVTGVSAAATYTLGSVPAAACHTTDALSGVAANATAQTTGGPVGSVTVTCSGGVDNAGNAGAPASVTYSVIYAWTGFFRPIDNLPTVNSVKAGSAVPVKFSLGGYQGLDIMADNFPRSVVVACDATAPVDAIDETTTAGSSTLTYDALSGQYIYVWKTEKNWTGCRQLQVKLADGTNRIATFKFTR